MVKKLTGVRKLRTVKARKTKPIQTAQPQYAVRLDRQLTDDEVTCIVIDTPFGELHVAGKVVTFNNTLLEIEDALIYGRNGLTIGGMGRAGINQTAQAVMRILNVQDIKISGWRSTGARPGHQSRTKTFRR